MRTIRFKKTTRQPASNRLSATGYFQPSTDNRQPTTVNRQPTTDNRQPTTDNRQPTTDNRQPSTGYRQPTTVNRLLSTGNRLLAILLLLAIGVSAQEKPQKPATSDETISIETTEVLLPVTVRDSTGAFVPNLKAEDFQVFEDGTPQIVSSFAFKRMPVHVVLLIDTSSSVTKEIEDFKAAALRFVEQLDPEDRVCLIRFDDVVELVQDWTGNRATFKRALNRLQTGMFTKFNDALYLAAHEQLGKVRGRKAVIVLTDGIDSGRGMISSQRAFRTLLEEETAVYVVSKTRIQGQRDREELAFYSKNSPSSGNQLRVDGLKQSLEQLEESERYLTKIADETGGRIFLPENFDDLSGVYQQVADELRSQYAIFYTPTNSARDGSYRAVRVKARQQGLHVTTRFGYYSK